MSDTFQVVILTGAGISAESGLGTFRGTDGLWTKYNLEDVATPEAFRRDPEKVLAFYNMRREGLADARPHDAHHALAELEQHCRADFLLVTQNIDTLHEQAGSSRLVHMHGRLDEDLCSFCGAFHAAQQPLSVEAICPSCHTSGGMRPNVVWFGELPHHMDAIYNALRRCDLFVSIGTSGTVYPAAGFVMEARRAGAHTVELNLEPSESRTLFDERLYGPASKVVRNYVDHLLEQHAITGP